MNSARIEKTKKGMMVDCLGSKALEVGDVITASAYNGMPRLVTITEVFYVDTRANGCVQTLANCK
jgi:hypothetical protein